MKGIEHFPTVWKNINSYQLLFNDLCYMIFSKPIMAHSVIVLLHIHTFLLIDIKKQSRLCLKV
jgi:hypothetical protein